MLKTSYEPSADSREVGEEYKIVNDFLQGQYLEAPPLRDHSVVIKVTLDSKEIGLADHTINGLFSCLNK